jgi:hypothetical protein
MTLTQYYVLAGSAPDVPPDVGEAYYDYLLANVANLRFLYKLDEPSGTTMTDSGGSGLDGSYTNAPGYGQTGPLASGETGMSFNGTDEYGSRAHHANFDIGTSDFSIGFWLKDAAWPTGGAEHYLVAHDGDGGNSTWAVYQIGNSPPTIQVLYVSGAGAFQWADWSHADLADGNWHLVGFSIDRDSTTGGQVWFDGVQKTSYNHSSSSGFDLTASKTLYIARRQTTGYAGVTMAGVFMATSLVDWAALYAARNGTSGGGEDTQAETFDEAVLALSPKAYYLMDEATGTTMVDASTFAHDGTYSGGPTLGVSGPMTGAYGVTFAAASSQYASVPDNGDIDLGTGDYTLQFWMKRSAAWPTGEEYVIAKDGNLTTTSDYMARLGYIDDNFQSWIPGTTTITVSSGTGTNLNDDAWHMVHVVMDRDGNGQWYVDGSAYGSTTSIAANSATSMTNALPLYIARRQAGNYFTGSLSRVAIYASALSSGQIAALWTAAGH